ncbi:hypothetical protein [Halobaculum sp. MBLA0143]|uniref:hypothetical protein n=1 Tax=Halobaculum sp. MBLA0143 TaxID=3079933 RepID=UPI0035267B06
MSEATLTPDDLGTLVPSLLVVVGRFTNTVRDETGNPADVVGSRPLLTPSSLLSGGAVTPATRQTGTKRRTPDRSLVSAD